MWKLQFVTFLGLLIVLMLSVPEIQAKKVKKVQGSAKAKKPKNNKSAVSKISNYGYAIRKPVSQFDNIAKKLSCALGGQWFDQWGNDMILTEGVPRGNTIGLEGFFQSKYQLKSQALLHGSKSYDNKGITFGIIVAFEGGAVAGFTGECYMKGSQEILQTAWILRFPFDEENGWRSTKVGECTFRRYKQKVD